MAAWMLAGGVSSGGRWRSRGRATSARRSLSFIVFRQLLVERLDARLSLGVGKNELDLLLDLFQLLIAEAGEANPFLEQLQRLVERQLLGLEALHDLLELLEGFLEIVGAWPRRHAPRYSTRGETGRRAETMVTSPARMEAMLSRNKELRQLFGKNRPKALHAQRARVDGAVQPSLLELHFDGIADGDDGGVEDRLASALGSREGDGVAARQDRERRDGLQRRRGGLEAVARPGDARGVRGQRL